MTDMSVDLAGVRLPNPMMTASGCAANGREMHRFIDVSQLGAYVTQVPYGQLWTLIVVLAAIVSTCVFAVRSFTGIGLVTVLSFLPLIPQALMGHSAGASGHTAAVNSIGLHLIAVVVWVGGFDQRLCARQMPELAQFLRRHRDLVRAAPAQDRDRAYAQGRRGEVPRVAGGAEQRFRRRRAEGGEAVLQVGDQVGRVLQPDGQAHQRLRMQPGQRAHAAQHHEGVVRPDAQPHAGRHVAHQRQRGLVAGQGSHHQVGMARQVFRPGLDRDIEGADRLVGDDELGVDRQGTGDADPLPLAAAQPVTPLADQRRQPFRQLRDEAFELCVPHALQH